jgi:hypothetical protein
MDLKTTEYEKSKLEELRTILSQDNLTLNNLKTEVVVCTKTITGATVMHYKKEHSMEDYATGKAVIESEFYVALIDLFLKYGALQSSSQLMPLALDSGNRYEKRCIIQITNFIDRTEPVAIKGLPHNKDCECGACTGEDVAIEATERGIVKCETNYEGEDGK